MRDANDLSDYVDYSSFPKQRLLIYSIRHQNGITRRKYIYIEFSRNIFSDDPYIFVRLFPRPRSFVTLCHLVAFSLVFRVAICIYIATVIRFFRRFFENCVYALFRNIEKFR